MSRIIYTAGQGVLLEDDTLSVNIDNKTIKAEKSGELIAKASEFNNAIVIQKRKGGYFHHAYAFNPYVGGERTKYNGKEVISLQGFTSYGHAATTQNGITIDTGTYKSENLSEIPNVPLYRKITFSPAAYIGTIGWTSSVEMSLDSTTDAYAVYKMWYTREDGTRVTDFTLYNYNSYSGLGFGYVWMGIYPPGTEYQGRTFEHGCAVCRYTYRCKHSATAYTWHVADNSMYDAYIPFASEAEYNTAVGLSKTTMLLTKVVETVTEV